MLENIFGKKDKKEKVKTVQDLELVTYVTDKIESVADEVYRMQYLLNMSYFAGKQWVTYDNNTKRLYEPSQEPYKVRLVANHIQPIIRTELSKITKNKPILECIPATNNDDDINSAEVTEKLIEFLQYDLNLEDKDKDVIMWALLTGNGFLKVFWNPSKGDKIQDPQTGEILKLGDVDIDIISPFEIRLDPTAQSFDEVQWIVHEKIRTVDYVKSIYGKDVKPEANLIESNVYDSYLKNMNNNFSNATSKPLKNSIIVKEYWEKPSPSYKYGRRITIAGTEVLFYSEDIRIDPKDNDEVALPFFMMQHISIPGRVYGMSVIENLIPIQREYNKTRSQLIEYKNLMGCPQWIVPTGSLVDDITDEPGSIIEYNNGMQPPRVVDIPPISADVYRNLDLCTSEFFFISGQNETSHGEAPAGVKSGVAIRFLQEQDDTKIGPTISNFINFKRKYMTYMLKLIQFKYDIPRTIKVVGEDKGVEVLDFVGSDIRSTDLRIQEATMFQSSKAAKQQWVLDLITAGVLNPETDRENIHKMLELGVSSLAGVDQSDVDKAQSEQDKWRKFFASKVDK